MSTIEKPDLYITNSNIYSLEDPKSSTEIQWDDGSLSLAATELILGIIVTLAGLREDAKVVTIIGVRLVAGGSWQLLHQIEKLFSGIFWD